MLLGYERDDCIFQDSFVAEIGDIYLLDTRKVHSVSRPALKNARSFIQCQWNISMNELLKILSIDI